MHRMVLSLCHEALLFLPPPPKVASTVPSFPRETDVLIRANQSDQNHNNELPDVPSMRLLRKMPFILVER